MMRPKPELSCDAGKAIQKAVQRIADQKKENLYHVAQRYALERFMFRIFEDQGEDARSLFVVPAGEARLDQSVVTLKGGMTMTFAENLPPLDGRSTGDVDLHLTAFNGSMEDLADILRRVLAGPPAVGPDDGIRFDVSEIHVARDKEERSGGTISINCQIGLLPMKIKTDCTFDARPMDERAQVRSYPSVLPGLDLGPLRVRCVPWEFMMADKFCAAVQMGAGNYRIRDYADMRVVMGREPSIVDEDFLAETIAATLAFKGLPMPESMDDLPGFADAFAKAKADRWAHERINKNYVVTEDLPTMISWIRERFEPVLQKARALEEIPGWASSPR